MARSVGAHHETEGADCADMMDCQILSAAHNAAITGPKCRVCAAFTIEMRQSVDIESLIISFPPGLRAEHQPDGNETSVSSVLPRHKWGTVWFQHRSPNGLSKVRGRRCMLGGFPCRCLRLWFICLLLTMGKTGERGMWVTSDSPLELRWWEDGSSARQRCSTPPCPKRSASVLLIVRHPLALFR